MPFARLAAPTVALLVALLPAEGLAQTSSGDTSTPRAAPVHEKTVSHAHHEPPHHEPAHRQPGHHPRVVVHPAHPVRHVAPPPPPAPAAPIVAAPVVPPVQDKGSNTGLPIPRFASLRADEVNLRGGPGTRYPIQWVYKRRDLPVEIEREFDVWRLIEDSDGVKGWVHQATLVGSRSFVVVAGSSPANPASGAAGASVAGSQLLRSEPQEDAAVVAILKPGVIGRIRACPAGSDWCRVSLKEYAGWLPRAAFWGLLPGETIQPP